MQYGLKALNAGSISIDEFLLLNAHIGGYKKPENMVPEGFPFGPMDASKPNNNLDPWSSRNATAIDHLDPDDAAPRAEGSLQAMRAAYQSGLVFRGDIDAPMLVLDLYLEPELNMHHLREKFEIRQRMLDADGDAGNLVLWAIDGNGPASSALVLDGLALLREWLDDEMKPVAARDACFTESGEEIARGEDVWNGVLTSQTSDEGACVGDFPIYDSARTVAGDRLTRYTFTCAVKSVETALTDGTYADTVTFNNAQETRLKTVFADGVCDYSQPDLGRPDEF